MTTVNGTGGGAPCPEGRGPDLLFRFPIAPFEEPYGSDCYFSLLGWHVFAGITLSVSLLCLLLHVATLRGESSRLFQTVRVAQIVVLAIGCGLILSGWFAPRVTYMFGVVFLIAFMSTGLLWNALGYFTIVKIVVKVRLSKDVTVVSHHLY